MQIRAEVDSDRDAIRAVNVEAFGSSTEADLIDALREQAEFLLSIVAEEDGVILGHVLFSPVYLSDNPDLKLMGLGPMAVVPTHQRQGIGAALVRAGLDECRQLGAAAVVVIGHPDYYPRFGFLSASGFDISSEFDVPDEVFMALELHPGALQGSNGQVRYHHLFSDE